MSSNNIETLLKSPSVESTHKHLYKSGSTPWKETYRKRCRERLAESRQKFVDRLRNCGGQDSQSLCDEFSLSVREAVIEEFINRKEEIFLMKEYNITEALATLDEITKEIMQETENTEQQILAEYEANLHLDEAMLCASIECLSTEDVLCPVCEKSPLAINKGVVSCQCGIVIDTEQDAVTLNMIKANLSEGLTDHSSACNNIPRFSVVNQLCMSNLLMTCEACDFFYIII